MVTLNKERHYIQCFPDIVILLENKKNNIITILTNRTSSHSSVISHQYKQFLTLLMCSKTFTTLFCHNIRKALHCVDKLSRKPSARVVLTHRGLECLPEVDAHLAGLAVPARAPLSLSRASMVGRDSIKLCSLLAKKVDKGCVIKSATRATIDHVFCQH